MRLHRLQNELISLAVSESGAELKSLKWLQSGREWMWQASPEFWPRTSPVLFPIVGKLNDNTFRHQGKSYPLSQHGFARDRSFEMLDSGDGFLRFGLSADDEMRRHYPFSFALELEYRLEENRLILAYKVRNEGKEPMPFSIGAHPGFSLAGWPSKKYFLEFEHAEELRAISLQDGLISQAEPRLIPTEERKLEISRDLFLQDALVFSGIKSTWLGLLGEGETEQLRLHFPGFPFLGIWSKPGAPFVCIEPWYGHADPLHYAGDISAKPGIQVLEPEAAFSCHFTIEIRSER
jgi:galactose mutarotase-like enzyme